MELKATIKLSVVMRERERERERVRERERERVATIRLTRAMELKAMKQ
jgi:hypothetical protein